MSRIQGSFYITGGTLGYDVPCYVPRQADYDLYDGLQQGEFCYVLTSRQMGKSSLMVRTAARLRAEGVSVAVLDLTAIGVNVTAEQWYDGLLARVARQLDLEDELDEFWQTHVRLSPLQRWMKAIEEVVLARHAGTVVIFVDEIDAVRSLPFSADEFFAAIRECYNRRSEQPQLRRLTFCLLGVATPSDLIRDARMTPFNIGRRIELHDFCTEEACLLAAGLDRDDRTAERLLQRIFDWTGGHPYLTQRLCQAVAGDGDVVDVDRVDDVCDSAFLSHPAREQDDNLIFVRQRILRSDTEPADVLELYGRVLRGKVVHADETDPPIRTLRLSGIVRTVDGNLRARNRIYRRVFDRYWIRASMPDAELRRQRLAFLRGLLRATAVASVVILILVASMLFALQQWQQAEKSAINAGKARDAERLQRQLAEQQKSLAQRAQHEAETAAEEAEEARDAERRQRELVEQQRTLAQAAQRKAETAAVESERAREAEQKQRELAEERRMAEEVARKEAEAAREETRLALARVEAEKRIAEQNAELARRRGELFEKLLPWLQDHAAEGVLQYAQSLEEQGKQREALDTFAAFCDLVLGDREGFLAHELLKLDPLDLRTLDLDERLVRVRISVPPTTLASTVLDPAIELGEGQIGEDAADDTRKLVGRLHATKARLILEYRDRPWPFDDPLKVSVSVYDRAIALDAEPFHYYAGRASARFQLSEQNLRGVLTDLDQAVVRYPNSPKPPLDDEPITETHRQMARLQYAKGNVLELLAEQDATDDAAGLYEEAEKAHTRAGDLNPKDARFPLAVARSLRRRAARWPSPPRSAQELQRSLHLLDEAEALEPDLAEIYNQRGEVCLLLGKIAEARRHFAGAIQRGRHDGRKINLYRYYCNEANAYTRGAATEDDFRKALEAADQAITLQPDGGAEARYFRGLALWGLDQTKSALEAFGETLANDPKHIGALLARCQIVFESQQPEPTAEQLTRAVRDADTAVELVHQTATTSHDKAKAYYVHSLAWLRRHLDTKSEQSLVNCQGDLIKSIEFSSEYEQSAKKVFEYAASFEWKDDERREESQRLRAQFDSLMKR